MGNVQVAMMDRNGVVGPETVAIFDRDTIGEWIENAERSSIHTVRFPTVDTREDGPGFRTWELSLDDLRAIMASYGPFVTVYPVEVS